MTQGPPDFAIARSVRRAVVTLVVLAALVLALLVLRYAGDPGPGWIDSWAARDAQALAGNRGVLLPLVELGGPPFVVLSACVIAIVGAATGRFLLIPVALLGPLLTGLATTTLQPVVGRTMDGVFALPSGHTAGATSVAIASALLVVSLSGRHKRPVSVLCAVLVVLFAAAVACALVVNDLHYVSDTVAGFCTAVVVVLGTALVVDAIAQRHRQLTRTRSASSD